MKGLTEIICIIDRSGSMESTRDDAIGGFNAFLAAQKALPGKAHMTLTLFNTGITTIYANQDLQTVPDLDNRTYVPAGMTALLDAVGTTLTLAQARIAATAKNRRPGKVMVVIITDGMENSSKEYRRADVAAKTAELQNEGWQFLYLGADHTAFHDAESIGLSKSQFVAHSNNQLMAYAVACETLSSFRSADADKEDDDPLE